MQLCCMQLTKRQQIKNLQIPDSLQASQTRTEFIWLTFVERTILLA